MIVPTVDPGHTEVISAQDSIQRQNYRPMSSEPFDSDTKLYKQIQSNYFIDFHLFDLFGLCINYTYSFQCGSDTLEYPLGTYRIRNGSLIEYIFTAIMHTFDKIHLKSVTICTDIDLYTYS